MFGFKNYLCRMNVVKKLKYVCVLTGFLLALLSCVDSKDISVEGLPFRQSSNEGWGIVSTNGTLLVPAGTFKNMPSEVVNGVFVLQDDEGFYKLYDIRKPLQSVSPRRFARIGSFFEDVTFAQETLESPVIVIDKIGRTVFSLNQILQYQVELVHNYQEGLALFVTGSGKYGYMDTKGNIVIPPVYDLGYDFKEVLALVGIMDRQGLLGYQVIDKKGEVQFVVQQSDCLLDDQVADGLLMFKNFREDYFAYIGKKGIPVLYLPEEVMEGARFADGMAVFRTSQGAGTIDKKGDILIPAKYENIHILGNERLALLSNEKYDLTDEKGQKLVSVSFDSIGSYYDTGLAVVKQGDSYGWIDERGKKFSDFSAQSIKDHISGLVRPQRFYRQVAITKEDSQEKKEEPKKKSEQPIRRRMNPNAWREIAKQNPFYKEAERLVSGNLEEKEAENRRVILNYVEHLRTSYTTKDIDFLEQLFSEDALIIVGTVINSIPQKDVQYLPEKQVLYNIKSKREYLTRLKEVFRNNQEISVAFSEFRIMRHPTRKDIYGVTLRQHYSSDRYFDDGYLFLLWDFQYRTAPKIHVRTWQPSLTETNHPLSEKDVFSIRNFNLQ